MQIEVFYTLFNFIYYITSRHGITPPELLKLYSHRRNYVN
jgi:hypothetical protein